MNNKDLSLEKLQKSIQGYFEENPEVQESSIFPKHFTGNNEDGTRYSYWKIGNIITGDGGKELFDKAFEKEIQKRFGKLK